MTNFETVTQEVNIESSSNNSFTYTSVSSDDSGKNDMEEKRSALLQRIDNPENEMEFKIPNKNTLGKRRAEELSDDLDSDSTISSSSKGKKKVQKPKPKRKAVKPSKASTDSCSVKST